MIYPIDIPLEVSQVLGFTHAERINTLVVDAISASARGRTASVSPRRWREAMAALQEFMFANVYTQPRRQGGGEQGPGHAAAGSSSILPEHPDELPADYPGDPPGGGGGPGGVRLYRRA